MGAFRAQHRSNRRCAFVSRTWLAEIHQLPVAGQPVSMILWVQGTIEIVGGVMMLVGVFTRSVAFILSGDMTIAYFVVHFPNHGA